MKYIVMECHETYAVLLDEEAGFVKAENQSYTVGDVIENPRLYRNGFNISMITKITSGLAAAAACLAVVFGIAHYREYSLPYTDVRLSINPDVMLVLNHHGQVLTVEGLNEDGVTLIDGYSPDKQDKIVVADELFDRAIEMGFLTDGKTVVFEIDTPDEKLLNQYTSELQTETESYLSDFKEINIIVGDHDTVQESQGGYNESDYEPIIIPIPDDDVQEETDDTDSDYGDSDYASGHTDYDDREDMPAHTTDDDDNNNYGESDYGDDDEPYETQPPVITTDNNSNYGDSVYDETDSVSNYGDSIYDETEADSNYGDSLYDDYDDD